jgi:hypothetical protein
LFAGAGSMTHGFLRERSHSINSCFTSGYSKTMPTATNAVEIKSQVKSDCPLASSAFLAGDSSADEVCRMRASWYKLLVFMAIVYAWIIADAVYAWWKKPRRHLILVFGAILLASIPSNAALLSDGYSVHVATNITGRFSIGVDGFLDNSDRQFRAFRGVSQMGSNIDSVSMFSFGTELGRYIKVIPSSANLSFQLPAGPTIGPLSLICDHWGNLVEQVVSINNDPNCWDQFFANKDPAGDLSAIYDAYDPRRINLILRRPIGRYLLGPILSNAFQVSVRTFAQGSIDSIAGQVFVVPALKWQNSSSGIIESGGTDAGKYELVAECRNLTVRAVWSWEIHNSASVISRQAIGSHYSLILREIEDHNRPRADLGTCRIRHKKGEHERSFRHMTLSSGDASILGGKFDDSNEKAPTCWGCTLLVSDDGLRWYEIIAVDDVP